MAVKKKFPYRAAVVACNGGCRSAEGEAGCADGCIGCKACIDKCKFEAISINEYGVAEVDEEKCIGCGACAKVCPQKVIHVHECANYIVVKCSNKKKGAEAKKQCDVSCIGCGICAAHCPVKNIIVEGRHAKALGNCAFCYRCVNLCPNRAISLFGKSIPEKQYKGPQSRKSLNLEKTSFHGSKNMET